MRMLLTGLLLSSVVASSGCLTVNAALPGTLRGDVSSSETEKIGELNIEKSNWFFLWGLVGAPPEEFFADDIKKQVQAKGGDGVANLTYESKEGCVDWGLTRCTGALVIPRTYIVTGDIVRIKKSPLPGKPAKVATSPDTERGTEVVAAQSF